MIKRTGPGFATVNAALKELDGIEAKTGWFETAKYPDGTPVAYVAAIQEFGAVTRTDGMGLAAVAEAGQAKGVAVIPPRPFMRPTVAAKTDEWMALLGRGATAVLDGTTKAPVVMEKVALRAAADVARTISEVFEPPLAASTIKAKKGATKPLIDSSEMFRTVTGVVEKTK